MTAHTVDQTFGDNQAQAGTAEAARDGGVCLAEGLEQLRLMWLVYAYACIGDLTADIDLVSLFAGQAHLEVHATAVGKLDGVADQVSDHLADPQGIARDVVVDARLYIHHKFEIFILGAVSQQ